MIPATPSGQSRLPLVFLALVLIVRAELEADPDPPVAVHASETETAEAETESESAGLLRLAGNLSERGEYAAAAVAYRQLLTQPQFAESDQRAALIGLGGMYRRQGAVTKAAAIYEKFLKEFPDDRRTPDILLELGRTLRSMGSHRLAISRFYSVINSTLKISPGAHDHYQQLARTAQFEIAHTHFAAGHYDEASKFFLRLRLLDLAPSDRARAHFKAAYAQKLAGQPATAVITLQAYLDQWPDGEDSPEAAYLLAVTLRELNRFDQSLAVTQQLLESVHAQAGRDPRLWAYWQRRTGNQLANDFFQNGMFSQALGIYQRLAGLSDDPAWRLPVTYQVALCQEKLGFTPDARASYTAVIEGTAALGNQAPPGLAEYVRISRWRLANLDWLDRTQHQLTTFFSTRTANTPATHDNPGNPATASAPVR